MNLIHSTHFVDVAVGSAPLADELIHLRGIAADMVQSALATGEDVHQQFHEYLLDVRVDHLSSGEEADYELVTFRVQHEGEWVEQANFLRTTPHVQFQKHDTSVASFEDGEQQSFRPSRVM
jgi:hypothetical protein